MRRAWFLGLLVLGAVVWMLSRDGPLGSPESDPEPMARARGTDAPTPSPIELPPRLTGKARHAQDDAVSDGLWVHVVDGSGEPVSRGKVWLVAPRPGGDVKLVGYFRNGRWLVPRGRILAEEIPAFWIEVYDAGGGRFAPAQRGPYASDLKGPITVVLPRACTIHGRVVDQSGAGVPDVFVSARSTFKGHREGIDLPKRLHRLPGSARTDAAGYFTIGGLAPTDYLLVCDLPPAYREHDPVVAFGDEQNGIVPVMLRPEPEVEVLDWRGQPVVGARVEVKATYLDSSTRLVRTTDGRGRARFEELDVNRIHTLEIIPPEDREDLVPHTQYDWRPDEVAVKLRRGYAVEGVVRDRRARPAAGVAICATIGSLFRWARSGPDGRFRVTGLPEGNVHLRASPSRAFASRPEGVDRHLADVFRGVNVPAGTRGVVVPCEAVASVRLRLTGGTIGAQARIDLRPADDHRRFCVPVALRQKGFVIFRDVDPNVDYRLWIHDPEAGLYAEQDDVRASPEECVVELQSGGTITCTFRWEDPRRTPRVQMSASSRGRVAYGVPGDGGAIVFRGLPDGTWHIHATTSDRPLLSGRTEARVGEHVEMELKSR